jgi:hypothetical protein
VAAPRSGAALERDVVAFLGRLSLVVQRMAAYPPGHPQRAAAVDSMVLRLASVLDRRAMLVVAVARDRLVVDGVPGDPPPSVLGELALRLYRRGVGGLEFARGVTPDQLTALCAALVAESSDPSHEFGPWRHARILPPAYDRLGLAADSASDGQSLVARLWTELARGLTESAGVADTDAVAVDPDRLAALVTMRLGRGDASLPAGLLQRLATLARELRGPADANAIEVRAQLSEFVAALPAGVLESILRQEVDLARRREDVLEVADGVEPSAAVSLVEAAAVASDQPISPSIIRLLGKLARAADVGGTSFDSAADAVLRDAIGELVRDWTLADPNPASYTTALDRLAREHTAVPAPAPPSPWAADSEPLGVLAIGLELDLMSAATQRALDSLIGALAFDPVIDILELAPPANAAAAEVWRRLAAPDVVHQLLADDERYGGTLQRILTHMGAAAAGPLLDALATTDSRAARRRLLTRLERLGDAMGPLIVERLARAPWYMQRNLLALLGGLQQWPAEFDPLVYATHDDPRVRREAIKLMLQRPPVRERALLLALGDSDRQIVHVGLAAALEDCPPPVAAVLVPRLNERVWPADLHAMGVRALSGATTPAARDWLVRRVIRPRRLFGNKLAPKSPELLAALAALVTRWAQDPYAAAALRRAAASRDPEIRAAVTGSV